jgi:MFS family permease
MAATNSFKPDPSGMKFLGFWITPGLTRGNVGAIFFASFTTVAMVVYLSLIQPYILTEIVGIPHDRQGIVTGYLALMQEIIVIALVGFMGAWSDRVGRRRIYVLGLCALAVGYLVYPMAGSELGLYVYRIPLIVGIAMAPVMLNTTLQDAPQEVSRGKWLGINNVIQGSGILLLATLLLTRAPQWYVGLGFDGVTAGRLALWSAALICLIAAVVMRVGLPVSTGAQQQKESVRRQFLRGVKAGLQNPRLALGFGAAFIGRGDLIVVGLFFSLWVTQYGVDQGLSTADSVAKAGMLFGIIQLSALLWAFFMGIIMDRVNRVTGVIIAFAFAAAGYGLMGQVQDPFGPAFIPIAVLLGIGEVSVIVSAGALVGQEARASMRGAIIGARDLVGGAGIMFAGFIGGVVFDAIGRTAPFTMMGILNATLMVLALVVRFRAGAPSVENNDELQ